MYDGLPPAPYRGWQKSEECMVQKYRRNFQYWAEQPTGLVRLRDNIFVKRSNLKDRIVTAVKYTTYPLDPRYNDPYYMMPMIKFYYPEIYNTIQKLLVLK